MNLSEHFRAIRAAYDQVLPEWLEDYAETGNMWHDPYLMDWKFSPIESLVWGDIRDMGLPFYPQMPAAGYYIDFGNPFLRIGIECDGKAWHDKERDRVRDERLAAAGWMIFRIEGHECKRTVDRHWEGDTECLPMVDWGRFYGATAEGVLHAIKRQYFDDQPQSERAYLADATLFNHRSTPETYPARKPRAARSDGPVRLSDLLVDYVLLLEKRMQRPAPHHPV